MLLVTQGILSLFGRSQHPESLEVEIGVKTLNQLQQFFEHFAIQRSYGN